MMIDGQNSRKIIMMLYQSMRVSYDWTVACIKISDFGSIRKGEASESRENDN